MDIKAKMSAIMPWSFSLFLSSSKKICAFPEKKKVVILEDVLNSHF